MFSEQGRVEDLRIFQKTYDRFFLSLLFLFFQFVDTLKYDEAIISK